MARRTKEGERRDREATLPRNLRGGEKVWVQSLIVAGMMAYVWRCRRTLGIRTKEVPRYMKDLLTLAAGPVDLKYVHFGKQIFVDAWTPPCPTEGFFRAVTGVPNFVNAQEPAKAGACIYAVLSLTNRCMYRCEHCYTSHTLERRDRISREKLVEIVERMLDHGVGILSIEGGEPLLRYEALLELLDLCRGRTNPYIATTGWSVTPERARQLADRGLVAAQVSLDHHDPDEHNAMRRSPKAFDVALRALTLFREAGVFPVISMVPTPELVDGDGLYRFLDFAKEIGVGMIQVLEPLPSGANAGEEKSSRMLNKRQRQAVYDFQVTANSDPAWQEHPNVSARLYVESEQSIGCGWGGMSIYYVDSFGNVEPCPFTNMSVGNVLEEDFDVIYARMRRLFPRPIGGLCPAYSLTMEEERARALGEPLPLAPHRTEEVSKRYAARPLPRLLQKIDRKR